MVVFFAHLRARRFHAQVTRVWVRCVRLADGDFALHQGGLHTFDYLTAWSLGRQLLAAFEDVAPADLQVQALRCVDHLDPPDGSFDLLTSGEPMELVRPRPAPQQREVTELDKLEKKKTKQRVAAVRRVAPVPDVGAPPVAADHGEPVHEGEALANSLIDVSDEDDTQTDDSGDDPPDRADTARMGAPDRPARPPHLDSSLADLSHAPPSILAALFGKGVRAPEGPAEPPQLDSRLGDLAAAPPSVLAALFGKGVQLDGSGGDAGWG